MSLSRWYWSCGGFWGNEIVSFLCSFPLPWLALHALPLLRWWSNSRDKPDVWKDFMSYHVFAIVFRIKILCVLLTYTSLYVHVNVCFFLVKRLRLLTKREQFSFFLVIINRMLVRVRWNFIFYVAFLFKKTENYHYYS